MAAAISRIKRWIPAALFVCGVLLMAVSVVTGEADVSLVIVFPVFTGSGLMFVCGILLIIAGFFAFFLTMAGMVSAGATDEVAGTIEGGAQHHTETHYGGLVLIGPVPIAFGSDRRTVVIMLIIGIALALVFIGILVVSLLVD